jgi:hypothetical protein
MIGGLCGDSYMGVLAFLRELLTLPDRRRDSNASRVSLFLLVKRIPLSLGTSAKTPSIMAPTCESMIRFFLSKIHFMFEVS